MVNEQRCRFEMTQGLRRGVCRRWGSVGRPGEGIEMAGLEGGVLLDEEVDMRCSCSPSCLFFFKRILPDSFVKRGIGKIATRSRREV